MLNSILEMLVWLQNIPFEFPKFISVLTPYSIFAIARLIEIKEFSTATQWSARGPSNRLYALFFSTRFSRLFFIACSLIGLPLLFIFLVRPIPNNAGMSALEIKFFGVSNPSEESQIEKTPPRQPKSLVVFLHGWRGDDTTFGQFPDLIAHDPAMKDFAYTIFRYPVHMKARNLRAYQVATALRAELVRADVEKKFTKIYIVAHSLGGVVARQLFVFDKLDSRLHLPLRGIVSIASPYNGAAIADIANVLGISAELTEDIGRNSSYLATLESHWQLGSRDQKAVWIYCFGSTIDRIVSSASATFGCGANVEHVSDFGHVDLVKPDEISDQRYSRVIKTILRDGEI